MQQLHPFRHNRSKLTDQQNAIKIQPCLSYIVKNDQFLFSSFLIIVKHERFILHSNNTVFSAIFIS